MANSRFNQFLFSKNPMLTMLEGNCVIDSAQSSGIRSLKGSGIKSVAKVATGIYKIQLDESFNRYLVGSAGFVASVGTPIAIATGVAGSVYVIAALGTTSQAQFELAGVPAGIPAAVGLAFVASADIALVTGTAFIAPPAASGISCVEIVGNPNLSIANISDPHFFIATMGATATADTALIPKAPADNSVLGFSIMLRNSSLKGKGE